MKNVNLSSYDNSWYAPGASFIKRFLWYYCNIIFFICRLNPSYKLKVFLLRCFGAKVGKNVVIKPAVNIKFPWKLKIGNNVWIGESAWIDNLDDVTIGNNCCISQGAMLLCGNHNYKAESFDLFTQKIILEDGVWIGASSMITPGIICKTHAILAVNSTATSNLEPYTIYRGNPAKPIRKREIE